MATNGVLDSVLSKALTVVLVLVFGLMIFGFFLGQLRDELIAALLILTCIAVGIVLSKVAFSARTSWRSIVHSYRQLEWNKAPVAASFVLAIQALWFLATIILPSAILAGCINALSAL